MAVETKLDVHAFSQSVGDERSLQVIFGHPPTAKDRANLLAAINDFNADALRPSPSSDERVKVKALEWTVRYSGREFRGGETELAGSIFGQWQVFGDGSWSDRYNFHEGPFGGTLATAKAAAQADYETRILSALDLPPEDAIAKAIYETDPHYEGGEYVDSFQVSPGGNLTWEQACDRDAEFANVPQMLPITKFARDAAKAVVRALQPHKGEPAE